MSRDTLSDLLRSVRVRGAVFYYVSCSHQWSAQAPPSAEIAAAVIPGCEHVMEYHMVARGNGWAATSGQAPVRLAAGDVVLFPQGDSHVISSAPDIVPIRQEAEWVFSTRNDPKPIPITYRHGIIDAGGSLPARDAETVMICGFIGCDLRPFNPLIAALPRLLHLPAAEGGAWINHVIDQAVVESQVASPGGNAVLERLSEMMFIDAARRYLQTLPEEATGWLAGLRDTFVGKALELMHERPERQWTVDELARDVGLSRSALHERFTRYLGLPPMQYLANWRIQVGARMLRESNRTVAAIAADVGYDSEAAFSRAFKRLVGLPPATWRRAQTRN